MKTPEDHRKEWAFGACPHGPFGHAQSIDCGKCLEEAFAKVQREAIEEALEEISDHHRGYPTCSDARSALEGAYNRVAALLPPSTAKGGGE